MPNGKPNILIIWGDDIGITNLSCYSDGLMGYRTPNIDRIADEGCALPIRMASRTHAAAPPSSRGRIPIAPASPKWACRRTIGLRQKMSRLPSSRRLATPRASSARTTLGI